MRRMELEIKLSTSLNNLLYELDYVLDNASNDMTEEAKRHVLSELHIMIERLKSYETKN